MICCCHTNTGGEQNGIWYHYQLSVRSLMVSEKDSRRVSLPAESPIPCGELIIILYVGSSPRRLPLAELQRNRVVASKSCRAEVQRHRVVASTSCLRKGVVCSAVDSCGAAVGCCRAAVDCCGLLWTLLPAAVPWF